MVRFLVHDRLSMRSMLAVLRFGRCDTVWYRVHSALGWPVVAGLSRFPRAGCRFSDGFASVVRFMVIVEAMTNYNTLFTAQHEY